MQKVVFHEFQRLDQGAKVARGLGLGLSIVERIARVLDHPLRLASEPGRGTVFRIEAPIVAAQPASAAVVETPRTSATPLAGLTILAIDNEPAILDGMRTLLAGWGCTVITAASFEEAQGALDLALITPEVIIADYHLDAGHDGLDAIRRLRASLSPDHPAILLTAERSLAVRHQAIAAGVHVLHKPLKPAALRALLAQWRATRVAAE
jgi:CheY-like chemotaxis protein